MNSYCVFLTACVTPNGMSYTVLQDTSVRLAQYKEALSFYLENTEWPIVLVENTNYDFSKDYADFVSSGRLEYLTFDGNNYDKTKGKGYGEALIMKYALENSTLLKNCDYIVKITGRIIVPNIKQICSSWILKLPNVFQANIKEEFISTYIFITTNEILKRFVDKYTESITEEPKGRLIENFWFKAFSSDSDFRDVRFYPFVRIPDIVGISATTGEAYSTYNRQTDNLFYSYKFEIVHGRRTRALIYKYLYFIFYYGKKLLGKTR